jgi:hypothetical protein
VKVDFDEKNSEITMKVSKAKKKTVKKDEEESED